MDADLARVARQFHREPGQATPADEALVHALLVDPQGDPRMVERAGWALLRAAGRIPETAPEAAGWIETDSFARDLLTETQLTVLPVERLLTAMRRWLLLEGRHSAYPLTRAALIAQTAHNGGVWLFDEAERAAIAAAPDFAPAYRPPLADPAPIPDHASPVTRAVATQFTEWPFPVWQRVLALPGATLDPDGDILVAGCGTGREALRLARHAPAAKVLAIDLSAASIAYARARCGDAVNLEFRQHDLHHADALGRGFDHISCCGVLHHLPDPEAGWAALAGVLRPGGTMRVMLYSRIARLQVDSARRPIADLIGQPATPDLMRAARARLMDSPIAASPGFYTMGGVRDLLLYAHEDRFDIPRIGRALQTLGLELTEFALPGRAVRERYLAQNPHDPGLCDLVALAAFERAHPRLFGGMYDIRCRKP